jgi:YHS domain-containing protein
MQENKTNHVRTCGVLRRSIIMATDPVCLTIVDVDEAKYTTEYRNQKYYFCCNYCKKQFEENPKRYSRLAIDASVDLDNRI